MAGKVRTLLNIQRQKLEELELSHMEGIPTWAYISTKAARFLAVGAEIYQKQDYFHYPLPEWNIKKLIIGCEQIIYNCAGLPSPETCFINLSETEVIYLFELFHFSNTGEIQYKDNSIAEMNFIHKMDKRKYSAYYKIEVNTHG